MIKNLITKYLILKFIHFIQIIQVLYFKVIGQIPTNNELIQINTSENPCEKGTHPY